MEIKNISLHELKKMNGKEGLVLQGCGGDLQEWVDGINDMLTENEILRNGSRFEKAYTFKNERLTCLLFPFDGVQPDVGKLAIWRLETRENFGSTWLSDYVPNNLGGFIEEQIEDLEMQKNKRPKCLIMGADSLYAWSAPHPILEKLSEMYPDITFEHEWADEDIGSNYGRYAYFDGERIEEYFPESSRERIEFAAHVMESDPSEWGLYLNASETDYDVV